jgi:hypothetical protein
MDHETVLIRKIKALFPDSRLRDEANSTLNLYGVEKFEKETIRVRLAILKLSGNDLEQLKINTKHAKEDFRDILSWAESPNLGKVRPMPNGPEKQKLIIADKSQYEEWLRI